MTDTDTGKVRVNVRLPVGVVKRRNQDGRALSPEVKGFNMSLLMEFVRAGETGQIVDLYDEDDGEQVEVYIE